MLVALPTVMLSAYSHTSGLSREWSASFICHVHVLLQVLRKDYDCAADIWSAGVIMYILLCGSPPFGGKSDSRILQKVQQGSYSFANREWDNVTEAAKDMITQMLKMDISDRATADRLLKHRWFKVCELPASSELM